MTTGRPSRSRLAARGAAALCSGISAFQVVLAAGAPLGRAAWGGGSAELSELQRVASGGMALVWGGAAAAFLAFSGDLAEGRHRGSRGLRRVVWAVAGVGGVGTLMNLASPSPWERAIWAPVALATAVLAAVAARSADAEVSLRR